jgi:hypothetical protein
MIRSSIATWVLASSATLLILSNCSCTPKPKPPNPETGKDFPFPRLAETPDQAAELALQYLAARGEKDSMFFKFGFPSMESLKSAKLGHAVRTVQVDCHKLKQIGQNVNTLMDLSSLGGSSQTLYPVVNDASTRMGVWVDSISDTKSFTHKKDKGRFTMIRMGGAETAIGLMDELQKLKAAGNQEDIVLVEIPTFSQTLAAYQENGILYARLVRETGVIDSVCQIPKDKAMPWQDIVKIISNCPQFNSVYCLSEEKLHRPSHNKPATIDSAKQGNHSTAAPPKAGAAH